MQDRVADVLSQRAALDRGAGSVVVVIASLLFHAGMIWIGVYVATRQAPPKPARMVSIEFAQMPAMQKPPAAPRRAQAPPALPTIEEPKPVLEEPKPVLEKPPPKPEKNTVPTSPFGQSTKKGSETPAAPRTSNQSPATSTAPEVAVGGSGVTGLEGGDFPYSLYLESMHRKIGSNWFRSPNTQPGTTVVIYFRILRDGKITDAKIETPSGNPTFDRVALSAVRSSSPLNPLPFAYAGNYLGVHLTFK